MLGCAERVGQTHQGQKQLRTSAKGTKAAEKKCKRDKSSRDKSSREQLQKGQKQDRKLSVSTSISMVYSRIVMENPADIMRGARKDPQETGC